ncbi:MAG TPA: BrnT family toxin, partial [Ktedonobacterales bacterium]|nr:BrnT family toxin [Ktedonobacterales bacterium]
SFDEAATVFADPLSLTIVDEAHADVEDRFIDIGESSSGRLLVVVYSEHDETIRIISCRPATSAERRTYEQQTI